jgi:hypothetical protein
VVEKLSCPVQKDSNYFVHIVTVKKYEIISKMNVVDAQRG